MNDIVVFLGPSLSRADAARELDALYLPPVTCGDVLRCCAAHPKAIGIVDGFFDRKPAVWHKEILFALSHGIPVFGAASMGALRAAELAPFGMVGIGEIFEAYRSGEYEDDDEVAVVHAPAEDGYRAGSEAMVNIRATVRRAVEQGALSRRTATQLLEVAKGLHYAARGYRVVLRTAEERGLPSHELSAFVDWLPSGRVDQKRLDAIALLATLRGAKEKGFSRPTPSFRLAHTSAWHELTRACQSVPTRSNDEGRALDFELLVDELIVARILERSTNGALVRVLAVAEQASAVDAAAVQTAAEMFRRERGLHSQGAFEAWIFGQGLGDDEELSRLFFAEAAVRRATERHRAHIADQVVSYLRTTGEFSALSARAAQKRAAIGEDVPDVPALNDETLFRWYFEERLQTAVPEDLPAYLQREGRMSQERLRRALVREWLFCNG